MEISIIGIYCLCDEFLKAWGFRDDPQCRMNGAEVMTTALVAAFYFCGNYERSRLFLQNHGYIPHMLSKSRFNRRLHAFELALWYSFFQVLGQIHQQSQTSNEYVQDSCPIPVCDNIRISRCRLFQDEIYRGYVASKRRYFYGLRVHLLITSTGKPIEFVLAPGSYHDANIAKDFAYDLPEGSSISLDKAYNDYEYEELFLEAAQISFHPLRKKNSKRPREAWEEYLIRGVRHRVETTFSQISAWFPNTLHAVTAKGFTLKVVLFLVAFSIWSLSFPFLHRTLFPSAS